MRAKQYEIINELGVLPNIVPALEIQRRAAFLSHYLSQTGLRGFVLGISGGQDSLLAGLLAQQAVGRHRDEGYDAEFHAILLPYGTQSDRDDALAACDFIKPDAIHDLNIQPGVDAFANSFATAESYALKDFDKGNVKARMRMIAQYALASDQGLLVVGTDHAAEAVTGFFTKYGDGGADIVPLAGLTKRQGRALLREFGAPKRFTTKAPTADLLDARPGQTDEIELGISYNNLDNYLEGRTVKAAIAEAIEARYDATRHKRTVPIAYATPNDRDN